MMHFFMLPLSGAVAPVATNRQMAAVFPPTIYWRAVDFSHLIFDDSLVPLA